MHWAANPQVDDPENDPESDQKKDGTDCAQVWFLLSRENAMTWGTKVSGFYINTFYIYVKKNLC